MRSPAFWIPAALAIASLALTTSARAATWVVRPDGAGDYPTIQEAIAVSASGDSIELTDGTFTGPGNRDLDYGGRSITIRSLSGNPDSCVIDCEGSALDPHIGFYFHSHESTLAVLEGVTVRHGWGQGSAVWCERNSGPTLRSCTFRDGSSSALYYDNSDLHLYDCRVLGNAGNGILGEYAGGFVQGTVIEGNVASEEGGGARFNWSQVVFIRTRFTGNSAPHGGAIYSHESTLDFWFCVMDGNAATQGGVAYTIRFNREVTFRNCTLAGNRAEDAGSAIAGSAYLFNCIVCDSPKGIPVLCDGAVRVRCCDIFGNVDGDFVGCIAGYEGIYGNFSADPQFCRVEPGDYTIRNTSPCSEESNPECGLIGALPVACYDPSDAPAPGVPGPPELRVIGPNPFTSRIELRGGGSGILVIAPTGRILRHLAPAVTIVWDGHDDQGRPAPAGIYLLRRPGDGQEGARVVLLR